MFFQNRGNVGDAIAKFIGHIFQRNRRILIIFVDKFLDMVIGEIYSRGSLGGVYFDNFINQSLKTRFCGIAVFGIEDLINDCEMGHI
jgi:hypothetical protein